MVKKPSAGELIDATIPEIQAALAAGTVTSRDLVRWTLGGIKMD